MLRVIFWVALIAVGFWLWRKFKQPGPASRSTNGDAAPMVRCACCGIHVPQIQALPAGGQWYCSQQHLSQGPQAR